MRVSATKREGGRVSRRFCTVRLRNPAGHWRQESARRRSVRGANSPEPLDYDGCAELGQRDYARHLLDKLLTSYEMGDLFTDGVDVAVRFGPQPASSLVTRLLLETRILTVAPPIYLKQHKRPKIPADLTAHPCIQYRDPLTGRPFQWEFRRRRANSTEIVVPSLRKAGTASRSLSP